MPRPVTIVSRSSAMPSYRTGWLGRPLRPGKCHGGEISTTERPQPIVIGSSVSQQTPPTRSALSGHSDSGDRTQIGRLDDPRDARQEIAFCHLTPPALATHRYTIINVCIAQERFTKNGNASKLSPRLLIARGGHTFVAR